MNEFYTAELRNARFVEFSDGKRQLVGDVYGDTKDRFKDGERIKTSLINRVEGDLYHTNNSTYKVTFAAAQSKPVAQTSVELYGKLIEIHRELLTKSGKDEAIALISAYAAKEVAAERETSKLLAEAMEVAKHDFTRLEDMSTEAITKRYARGSMLTVQDALAQYNNNEE